MISQHCVLNITKAKLLQLWQSLVSSDTGFQYHPSTYQTCGFTHQIDGSGNLYIHKSISLLGNSSVHDCRGQFRLYSR